MADKRTLPDMLRIAAKAGRIPGSLNTFVQIGHPGMVEDPYTDLHDVLNKIEINPSVDREGNALSGVAIVFATLCLYAEHPKHEAYIDEMLTYLERISREGALMARANATAILLELEAEEEPEC